MVFNKTEIETCDVTWNPWTGCNHECTFCYARKIAQRFGGGKAFPNGFKPTFHQDRINDPFNHKTPQVVFVVSMGDLFGNWMRFEDIKRVVDSCIAAPWHTYMFLTKNSENLAMFFDKNVITPRRNFWLGTSVGESQESWKRMYNIKWLGERGWNTFLSVEPLLSFPDEIQMFPLFDNIKWLIVGMQTNPLNPCSPKEIQDFDRIAYREDVKVFYKYSTLQCFGRQIIEPRRVFPTGFPTPRKILT